MALKCEWHGCTPQRLARRRVRVALGDSQGRDGAAVPHCSCGASQAQVTLGLLDNFKGRLLQGAGNQKVVGLDGRHGAHCTTHAGASGPLETLLDPETLTNSM